MPPNKIASATIWKRLSVWGFRGEALASIPKFGLAFDVTSRTAEQAEAAGVCGRESAFMDVTVKPAAHPVGTTTEVLDLFIRRPAQIHAYRKTEFNHIDGIIRRIALAF